MRNVLRVAALALGMMALVGCGGRPLAPGKEAAAGALFQSSRGALGAPGMLAQVMNSGAGATTEVKVNCVGGGSVAIRFQVDSGSQTSIAYDVVYDNCTYDKHTSLRGTLHMTFEVVQTSTSVSLALHLSGRVDFSGDISDHLEVDVTENVTSSDLTSAQGTVSITLNGTISDSSGTYTFDNETVTIDGSGFTKAPEQG